ncbi:hypothetical protein HORIV_21690 [Vreelandella olivaria]|uniref:Uncharacterized protein n=1 Tax=Vreelandella olivaria TaxID=390919 RepID=A0ABN5WS43_9GAMM|nr:hypothetical protein HORIV_21690 [Halomonas olivaria]
MALTLDQRQFADDEATHAWLADYARGFHALGQQHATTLVGAMLRLVRSPLALP